MVRDADEKKTANALPQEDDARLRVQLGAALPGGSSTSANAEQGAEEAEEKAVRAAAEVQAKVVSSWQKEEEDNPTCPYRVLGAPRRATQGELEQLYEARCQLLEGDGSEESARVLLLHRLKNANTTLSDDMLRRAYARDLKRRIKAKAWAKLGYANGLYEGDVRAWSMEEGEKPIRHGRGVTVSGDGEKYEGAYVDDMKHGIGMQFWKNGDLYLGHWQEDQMAGEGCYFYGTGQRYIGEFQHGRRHGIGRQVWPEGSSYTGEFFEGHREGKGILVLRTHKPDIKGAIDVGRYKGEWRDGHLHGAGVYEQFQQVGATQQIRYTGQFECMRFNGQGRLELANGDVYEGSFNRGRRDGSGAYQWFNNDRYKGPMRKNMLDGHSGLFESLPRGVKFAGQWAQNKPSGQGSLSQQVVGKDGEEANVEYEGQWDAGRKDGHGEFRWPGGVRYTGAFKSEQQHGAGHILWEDGTQWEGNFDHDKRHGAGVLKEPAEDAGHIQEHDEIWRHGRLEHSYKRDRAADVNEQDHS